MLRAVKIRLYPNKEQQTTINQLLGCCRYVYNQLLELKIQAYKEDGKSLSVCDLAKHYHNTMFKSTETPWLKNCNTKVVKQSIRNLDRAYQRFFKEHTGFPKFKSKKDKNTCTFPLDAISKCNTFETRHISLTKPLKNIPFRCSNLYWNRLRVYKDKIHSATLTRTKSGKYELSVLIDLDESEFHKFKHCNGNAVGIDLGVKDFVITSDGEVFENKHFLKSEEQKLKKLQRQLSRKQKGSKNREKVRIRLAKQHEHIHNKRMDYIHRIVNELLKEYDFVFMEDLNVQGILKNHKIAKAVSELGFYTFKSVLQNKATLNNKCVIFVDRFFPSSQLCSECGYRNKYVKDLSVRSWTCPECGAVHDRDINAARNILEEGLRIIGSRTAEYTLVDCPTVDDKAATPLKSSDRMKQEAETMNVKFS